MTAGGVAPAVALANPPEHPQRLLVRFAAQATAAERANALAAAHTSQVARVPQLAITVVVTAGDHVERARERLAGARGVRSVEVDGRIRPEAVVTDPMGSLQWHLAQTRVGTAWDYSRGVPSVVVAVLDTGVDYNHPELAGRVDLGPDYVAGDGNPVDEDGHGTHVAGLIAAAADNGVGGAGVAPGVRLLALRVMGTNGGRISDAVQALVHATDRGARVVNLSLSADIDSQSLRDAVAYARARGVVLTCAAGNSGRSGLAMPAAYPGCIAVGASEGTDERAFFSSYGAELDLIAPGVDIVSTSLGGGYAQLTGTSQASPQVAGVAALLASRGLGAASTRELLQASARDVAPAGWDARSGHGRVDAGAALRMAAARQRAAAFSLSGPVMPRVAAWQRNVRGKRLRCGWALRASCATRRGKDAYTAGIVTRRELLAGRRVHLVVQRRVAGRWRFAFSRNARINSRGRFAVLVPREGLRPGAWRFLAQMPRTSLTHSARSRWRYGTVRG